MPFLIRSMLARLAIMEKQSIAGVDSFSWSSLPFLWQIVNFGGSFQRNPWTRRLLLRFRSKDRRLPSFVQSLLIRTRRVTMPRADRDDSPRSSSRAISSTMPGLRVLSERAHTMASSLAMPASPANSAKDYRSGPVLFRPYNAALFAGAECLFFITRWRRACL